MLFGLLVSAIAPAAAAAPVLIVVETNNDASTNGDGACSLREALINSNTSSDQSAGDCPAGSSAVDIIDLTGGLGAINIGSSLPSISAPVFIDGGEAAPAVALVNAGPPATDGLSFAIGSKGSTLRGVKLTGFQVGVRLDGGGVTLYNNWIGTQNGFDAALNLIGVDVTGAGDKIGIPGKAPNIISGNGSYGIILEPTSSKTLIQNNWIGIGVTDAVLGNSAAGILVRGKSATIGGMKEGQGNVISGNSNYGIDLRGTASGTKIQRNLIGLSATGNFTRSNGNGIIDSGSVGTVVGGTMPAATNFISANVAHAIIVNDVEHSSRSSITISGNIIGLDAVGTTRPNGGTGVLFMLATTTTKAKVSNNLIVGHGTTALGVTDTFAPVLSGSTGNCIFANPAGFMSTSAATITFKGNYWGAADGPGGVYPGSGDPVDTLAVQVSPFLSVAPASCKGWQPKSFKPADFGFTSNTTGPVKFTWAKVSSASEYNYQLAEDPGLITDVIAPGTSAGAMFTAGPLGYGDYFWQVRTRALDMGLGQGLDWYGPVLTFYVTIQSSPKPEAVVKPGNVTLRWLKYGTTPTTYNLEWFTSSGCLTGSTSVPTISTLTTTLPGLTSGNYSWRVQPNGGPVMPCWNFSIP
jgi:hypothetical protein